MIIGVITAMDSEMQTMVDALESCASVNQNGFEFYVGLSGKNKVVVLKCGIGKVNAAIGTTLLIDKYQPDLIINSGIAGGVSGLKAKDLLIAEKLWYSDVDAVHFGYEFGVVPGMPKYFYPDEKIAALFKSILVEMNIQCKTGDVLTADTFRITRKTIVNEISTVCACEMEGTAVAQTCYRFNVPFLSIRFISDILDEPSQIENYQSFETAAGHLSADITLKAIRNL